MVACLRRVLYWVPLLNVFINSYFFDIIIGHDFSEKGCHFDVYFLCSQLMFDEDQLLNYTRCIAERVMRLRVFLFAVQ